MDVPHRVVKRLLEPFEIGSDRDCAGGVDAALLLVEMLFCRGDDRLDATYLLSHSGSVGRQGRGSRRHRLALREGWSGD